MVHLVRKAVLFVCIWVQMRNIQEEATGVLSLFFPQGEVSVGWRGWWLWMSFWSPAGTGRRCPVINVGWEHTFRFRFCSAWAVLRLLRSLQQSGGHAAWWPRKRSFLCPVQPGLLPFAAPGMFSAQQKVSRSHAGSWRPWLIPDGDGEEFSCAMQEGKEDRAERSSEKRGCSLFWCSTAALLVWASPFAEGAKVHWPTGSICCFGSSCSCLDMELDLTARSLTAPAPLHRITASLWLGDTFKMTKSNR